MTWHGRHQLTQPEGTWCFWAPEICTTSTVANDRARQAALTRARGAEAAKAMALGIGGDGGGGDSVIGSKVGGDDEKQAVLGTTQWSCDIW